MNLNAWTMKSYIIASILAVLLINCWTFLARVRVLVCTFCIRRETHTILLLKNQEVWGGGGRGNCNHDCARLVKRLYYKLVQQPMWYGLTLTICKCYKWSPSYSDNHLFILVWVADKWHTCLSFIRHLFL